MRRTVGIVAAIAVAALGTLLLVAYVRSAEDRALEGEQLVDVLVVDNPIAKGTPGSGINGSVRLESVPAKVVADGTITDLTLLEELVASTDLLPGEQLVASRFVAEEVLLTRTAIEAPPDTIEVTISLTAERALGGAITPGDVVAVIASFDPFDLNAFEPSDLAPGEVIDPEEIFVGTSGEDGGTALKTPNSTHLILHKILVTNVQAEQVPRTVDEELPDDAPALAPTGNLLISLAGTVGQVEKIVFTAEHGFLWLGAEGPDTPEPNTVIQTRETIYR